MNQNDYQRPTWKDFLSALGLAIVAFIVIAALVFLCGIISPSNANAQSVTRQGNVFVQDSSSHKIKKDTATLTKYFYMAADGTKYPIYMSSTGKCFILRTSAKTGKQYKQYLPEVTKQLNGK